MENLADRIALVLEETGKSQVELAAIAGTNKANINHLKTGDTKTLNAEIAYEIERKLGYSMKWLLFGIGDKRAVDPRTLGEEEAKLMTMWSDLPEREKADTFNYIAGRWAKVKLTQKDH